MALSTSRQSPTAGKRWKKVVLTLVKTVGVLFGLLVLATAYLLRPRDVEAIERDGGLPISVGDLFEPPKQSALAVDGQLLRYLGKVYERDCEGLAHRTEKDPKAPKAPSLYHRMFRSGDTNYDIEGLRAAIARHAEFYDFAQQLGDAPSLALELPHRLSNRPSQIRNLRLVCEGLMSRACVQNAEGNPSAALGDVSRAVNVAQAMDVQDTFAQIELHGLQRDVYELLLRIANNKHLTPENWDRLSQIAADFPGVKFVKLFRYDAYLNYSNSYLSLIDPHTRFEGPLPKPVLFALAAWAVSDSVDLYAGTKGGDYSTRMAFLDKRYRQLGGGQTGDSLRHVTTRAAKACWYEADSETSRRLFRIAVRALRSGKAPDVVGSHDGFYGAPFEVRSQGVDWSLASSEQPPKAVQPRAQGVASPKIEVRDGAARWVDVNLGMR